MGDPDTGSAWRTNGERGKRHRLDDRPANGPHNSRETILSMGKRGSRDSLIGRATLERIAERLRHSLPREPRSRERVMFYLRRWQRLSAFCPKVLRCLICPSVSVIFPAAKSFLEDTPEIYFRKKEERERRRKT